MRTRAGLAAWGAVLGLLAVLWGLQHVLPGWHANNLARIMVLALLACGYNLAFGYGGLLSLGHALFFACGVYGASLPILHWGMTGTAGLLLGTLAGGLGALLVGALALRTRGVSFMIVTLMFAQAFHLSLFHFAEVTGGDDGFALPMAGRIVFGLEMRDDAPRFAIAWGLLALGLVLSLLLMRSRLGRRIKAVRENEERARMLGHDPFIIRLGVLVLSGLFAGAAGAAQALLFGYAGASFGATQYSILPLLHTLLGGAGTLLGPVFGAGIMFYLIEIASSLTSAWAFVVGAMLVALVLFAPKGLLGWVRSRLWRDMP